MKTIPVTFNKDIPIAMDAILEKPVDNLVLNDMQALNQLLQARNSRINELEHELMIAHECMQVFTAGKEDLTVANNELAFQNSEKEKRAAELAVANKELAYQNEEKGKRAAELIVANEELLFQNKEKEDRAAELIIANKELAFQSEEKGKRAAELIVANEELAYQNKEKENRAAELVIANNELAFQNQEKENRASELAAANNELESFTYIASHDLQEPLRKIQTFADRVLKGDQELTEINKDYFQRMQSTAKKMKKLIEDLLEYSHINASERILDKTNISSIVDEIKIDLKDLIAEKDAVVEVLECCEMDAVTFQFRQLLYNLISNALKFSSTERIPHITIQSCIVKGNPLDCEAILGGKDHYHLTVSDNGIGFDQQYHARIFHVFQRLHGKHEYGGTGIGLAIVKKIVDNHHGTITATGELGKGASFDLYIPCPLKAIN
jgi:signal transduction histidine kinase